MVPYGTDKGGPVGMRAPPESCDRHAVPGDRHRVPGCPSRQKPALPMIISHSARIGRRSRPLVDLSVDTITPFRLHPLKGVGGEGSAKRQAPPCLDGRSVPTGTAAQPLLCGSGVHDQRSWPHRTAEGGAHGGRRPPEGGVATQCVCTGVHTHCGGGQDTDCTSVQVRGLSLTLQSMAMICDGLMAITLCVCSSERLWRSLDPGVLNHPGHGLDWSTPKGVAQTP